MLILDAHLDLSMNAVEWNRDLSRPIDEIRQREAGMTDRPDRGRGTVSFDELRRGRVGDHRRAERSSCSRALVAVAAGTEWNVDGELVPFGPARFSGERAAFELVVG